MHALKAAGKIDSAEYGQLVQQFYDRHVCRVSPPPARGRRDDQEPVDLDRLSRDERAD